MLDSEILKIRGLPKVLPQHPFARYTAGLGSSHAVAPCPTPVTSKNVNKMGVKVLGIFCSRRAQTIEEGGDDSDTDDIKKNTNSANTTESQKSTCSGSKTEKRHLYVRVQFDKTLVETLPLEIMREMYPQVLIDYLLSTAVWS